VKQITCPQCGEDFGQIALHWNGKKCNWPEFSDKQLEIMKGLLMGDADIKSGTNGSIFRVRMTNRQFLEWVSTKLSSLSRGVFLSESSDSQKSSALRGGLNGVSEKSNFKDLYGVRTVTHPQVDELNEWYKTGQKRYPNNITMEMLRMWYVTDGWNHNNSIRIRCKQQSDRFDEVIKLLKQIGIDAEADATHGTIRVSSSDSDKFFDMTEAPPGFEYKWPNKLSP
jgi:hypothetical protein